MQSLCPAENMEVSKWKKNNVGVKELEESVVLHKHVAANYSVMLQLLFFDLPVFETKPIGHALQDVKLCSKRPALH